MSNFITTSVKQFEYYQSLGTKTIEALTQEQLYYQPNKTSNSAAIIIQHLYGNMLSRWTDFLVTDGEKEWRNRDAEFEHTTLTKEALLGLWGKGWQCLYNALYSITENDLTSIIYIRNMGQTVQDAIIRQLCHYSYHVGQIVYIGKIIQDTNWQNLSIPKNNSEAYNKALFEKEKTIKHFNDK